MLLKTYWKLLLALIFLLPRPALALQYDLCASPNQSLSCAAAYEKIKTLKNPLTKKNFFDDGVHIKDGKFIKMPRLHIAQPDLDKDGVVEIIAALSEEKGATKNLFCKSAFECPHFIIQNRNTDIKKPRLKYFKTISATYAYGIGLSTDENVEKYQSLRVYKNNKPDDFNVYQYDKKTDQYYDLGKFGEQKEKRK